MLLSMELSWSRWASFGAYWDSTRRIWPSGSTVLPVFSTWSASTPRFSTFKWFYFLGLDDWLFIFKRRCSRSTQPLSFFCSLPLLWSSIMSGHTTPGTRIATHALQVFSSLFLFGFITNLLLVGLSVLVCQIRFVSVCIFSIFAILWNSLVGMVLLSVCRTNTMGLIELSNNSEDCGDNFYSAQVSDDLFRIWKRMQYCMKTSVLAPITFPTTVSFFYFSLLFNSQSWPNIFRFALDDG